MSITDVNSEFLGVKRLILMENAGKTLADWVWEIFKSKERSKIFLLCGRGGNGGDGMVAARHLVRNTPVSLCLLGSPKDISKQSTRINFSIITNMDNSIEYYEINQITDIEKLNIDSSSIIVDCLLGTGIRGNINEPLRTLIKSMIKWQKQGAIIVSADTPSGIDPNEGTKANVYLTPDFTGIFHKWKKGLTTQNSGEIRILPIGVPPEAEIIIGPGDLLSLKSRPSWSKKGDNGKILVIGGNETYSGAPALAAMAAIQAGVDLTTILAPQKISLAIRSYSPELIVNDYSGSYLTPEVISDDLIENYDVIIIGPGLGQKTETGEAISKVMEKVKKFDKPIVIDADALNILNLDDTTTKTILTPHSGEFASLTGVKIPNVAEKFHERLLATENISKQYPCVWVIKGHWDIVTDNFRTKINKTGTPRMTRGGTGDVLAGLIAGFFMQAKNPFYSACVGTYINGRAGMLAETQFSLSNLLKQIPIAIKESFDFIKQD
jgi:NAD(P)H-hydrate epimerase